MARNAADAADTTRPKGENFSASPASKRPLLTGTNRTRRATACRLTLPDFVAHRIDAEKFS
jgi:hypothetical protein